MNRPETAGEWAEQVFAADVRGGVKTPPYGFFFERPQAAEHHNFSFLFFNF